MTIRAQVSKLLHNPGEVLRNRWRAAWERVRFRRGHDYKTVDYWTYRHTKYGFDLRGVGDKTKSHADNVALLGQGKEVFLDVCRRAGVTFDKARVLDIGCGTGYFAGVLSDEGVKEYVGVDIVDTLFTGLAQRFPSYRFKVVDVSTQRLSGTYDLILAMDVLQHIVDEAKFSFALDNIKSVRASTGTIILSTHIGTPKREGFYVVRRPLEVFERSFPGFKMSEPVKYADSFVFTLRPDV